MVANRLSFLRLSLNAVMALAFCFVAVAAVSADGVTSGSRRRR